MQSVSYSKLDERIAAASRLTLSGSWPMEGDGPGTGVTGNRECGYSVTCVTLVT